MLFRDVGGVGQPGGGRVLALLEGLDDRAVPVGGEPLDARHLGVDLLLGGHARSNEYGRGVVGILEAPGVTAGRLYALFASAVELLASGASHTARCWR